MAANTLSHSPSMLVPYACRVVFRPASASTRSHAAISLETDTPTPIGIKHRSAITRIITFQSHCPSIVRFVLTAAACEGRITTYPRLCKANALHYVSSSPGTNSRQGNRSRRRVEGLGLLDEGLPHAQLLGDLRSWPSETLGHWPEMVSGKCPRPPNLNFHLYDNAVSQPLSENTPLPLPLRLGQNPRTHPTAECCATGIPSAPGSARPVQ